MNQCDGCVAGIPKDERGFHSVPYPSGSMKCQADRYVFTPQEELDAAWQATKLEGIVRGLGVGLPEVVGSLREDRDNYLRELMELRPKAAVYDRIMAALKAEGVL